MSIDDENEAVGRRKVGPPRLYRCRFFQDEDGLFQDQVFLRRVLTRVAPNSTEMGMNRSDAMQLMLLNADCSSNIDERRQ